MSDCISFPLVDLVAFVYGTRRTGSDFHVFKIAFNDILEAGLASECRLLWFSRIS